MFSKYKKPGAEPKGAPVEKAKAKPTAEIKEMSDAPAKVARKAAPTQPAQVTPMDKERKKKQRMQEIKLELHRTLLDNLNLSALEHASETDLRQEINSIASEYLSLIHI